MSAQPWFKFFPADWRSDSALRMCSPAARALWLEMLCIMSEADPCGHLLVKGRPLNDRSIAVQAGMTVDEVTSGIAELDANGVFSRTSDGVIFSRKMVRDYRKSAEQRAKAEKRWGYDNAGENALGNANGSADGKAKSTSKPMPRSQKLEELEPEARSEKLEKEDTSLRSVACAPEPPRPRPLKQAPDDWMPSHADLSRAASLGFTAGETERELTMMKNHTFATARKDWSKVFHNWLLESQRRRERSGNRNSFRRQDYEDEQQNLDRAFRAASPHFDDGGRGVRREDDQGVLGLVDRTPRRIGGA